MLYETLKDALYRIRTLVPGEQFSGAGIIVYDTFDSLPVICMGNDSVINHEIDPSLSIAESSLLSNKSHDGFNLISSKFKITHKNMYFSPPIDTNVRLVLSKGYGTRYVAALYGSTLSNVLLTGVISKSYGIVIFKDGNVLYKEE